MHLLPIIIKELAFSGMSIRFTGNYDVKTNEIHKRKGSKSSMFLHAGLSLLFKH